MKEFWIIARTILCMICGFLIGHGCRTVPSPPQEYVYDEGHLVVPQVETLKIVWETYALDITRVDVQILQHNEVVKEFRSDTVIIVGTENPSIPIFKELEELPSGRYSVQIRCYNPTYELPSPWSNMFLFFKDW